MTNPNAAPQPQQPDEAGRFGIAFHGIAGALASTRQARAEQVAADLEHKEEFKEHIEEVALRRVHPPLLEQDGPYEVERFNPVLGVMQRITTSRERDGRLTHETVFDVATPGGLSFSSTAPKRGSGNKYLGNANEVEGSRANARNQNIKTHEWDAASGTMVAIPVTTERERLEGPDPILAKTRSERSLERKVERRIRAMQIAEKQSKHLNSALGSEGDLFRPSPPWRSASKFRRWTTERAAKRAYKKGTISAFELEEKTRAARSMIQVGKLTMTQRYYADKESTPKKGLRIFFTQKRLENIGTIEQTARQPIRGKFEERKIERKLKKANKLARKAEDHRLKKEHLESLPRKESIVSKVKRITNR